MAEQANGNGLVAQNVAEHTLRRWALIAFLTVAGPISGFALIRLLGQLDTVVQAVGEMKTDVAVMKNDISYLKDRARQ